MSTPRQLSDKVAVGGQPTVEELHGLRAQGFAAVVINLPRRRGGSAAVARGRKLRRAEVGLAYSHLPVAIPELGPEHVRRLRATIEAAPGRSTSIALAGQRACALSLMAHRTRTLRATYRPGRAAGLPVTDERLKASSARLDRAAGTFCRRSDRRSEAAAWRSLRHSADAAADVRTRSAIHQF